MGGVNATETLGDKLGAVGVVGGADAAGGAAVGADDKDGALDHIWLWFWKRSNLKLLPWLRLSLWLS